MSGPGHMPPGFLAGALVGAPLRDTTVEAIAIICHEANRVYCAVVMNDHSQKEWDEAPMWQRDSARAGVRFHLEAHAAGREVPPSASHDSWLREKMRDGWTYGPVKDEVKKEHPCFAPYEQLPELQKRKDYLFGAIVRALSEDIS